MTYGTPRSIPGSVAITKVPDAYSLDNFGSILYAMTSADRRLLMWDPALASPGQATVPATAAFTTSSPNIYIASTPLLIVTGNSVYDLTIKQTLGTVQSIAPDNHALTAQGSWVMGATKIMMPVNPGSIVAWMNVHDTTKGAQVGVVSTYGPFSGPASLLAGGSYPATTPAIPMAAVNPGWVLPGMTVVDTTSSHTIGLVSTYPTSGLTLNAQTGADWTTSSPNITMASSNAFINGYNVYNASGAFIGVVLSSVGTALTLTANALHAGSSGDILTFNNYILTLTANAAFASSGTSDTLQIGGNMLTLAAPGSLRQRGI